MVATTLGDQCSEKRDSLSRRSTTGAMTTRYGDAGTSRVGRRAGMIEESTIVGRAASRIGGLDHPKELITMPAVTVDNILTLPRVTEPVAEAVSRPVRSVTTAPSGFEGEGFPVRRAFAGVDLAALDPFIHMDQ